MREGVKGQRSKVNECKRSMAPRILLICCSINVVEQDMYIIGNDSCYFMQLDILEPKVPEDIYKSHLEPNSE